MKEGLAIMVSFSLASAQNESRKMVVISKLTVG